MSNECELKYMLQNILSELGARIMTTSFSYDQFKPREMILQISFGICSHIITSHYTSHFKGTV